MHIGVHARSGYTHYTRARQAHDLPAVHFSPGRLKRFDLERAHTHKHMGPSQTHIFAFRIQQTYSEDAHSVIV